MVEGAPFPDCLNWTWGEIIEFIKCCEESRRERLRDQARMQFYGAISQVKIMFAKKDEKLGVVDAYPFLWSDEEKKQMAEEENQREIDEFERRMMAMVRKEDRDKLPKRGEQ